MKKASPVTFLQLRKRAPLQKEQGVRPQKIEQQKIDLNIFVVTFNGMKQAQNNLSGGDPYTCIKCKSILNKFSIVVSAKELSQKQNKFHIQLKNNESLWQCQFCGYPNVIKIDKQQIPIKDDVVYLIQSQLENMQSQNDSTMIFCIDSSGSMNTTTQIQGKIDLKFGLSQQQIEMLKQFMQPGDQAQFNFLPGHQNKNKTFISRKQCILSAIQSQLKQIKKNDPHKKIGFITFNNQVTILGDNKTPTVNILGDKLNNRQSIVDTLTGFKLNQSLQTSYQTLIKQLTKQQAKGQTALGPALVSAIEIASKGSPGSTVILCTDGLANIGIGLLDPLTQENKKLYQDLAHLAKQRNISVNIMTIKGQGCKMEVIGKLAELTNGNMKVVNPQKLSEDFANVLKDQVVGINVQVIIQLHRAMIFRNQAPQNLFDNGTILKRKFANATSNTKVSFQYELRCQEDLKFMEVDVNQLKKVPFQTQILYTSPRGGKFLRVVSSESKTTTDKKEMLKDANIGVAHQRVTALTANMYSKGEGKQSLKTNQMWSDYLMENFQQEKYQKKQMAFNSKNMQLNKAIEHKSKKAEKAIHKQDKKQKKEKKKQQQMQEEQMNKSLVDSDEDHNELMENLMEKQNYDLDQEE